MLAFLVLVQVAGQIHLAVAAVSVTSLKRSSVAAVAVIKQDHLAVKTLRSLHALISWQ
jgi:hypothetical protein